MKNTKMRIVLKEFILPFELRVGHLLGHLLQEFIDPDITNSLILIILKSKTKGTSNRSWDLKTF